MRTSRSARAAAVAVLCSAVWTSWTSAAAPDYYLKKETWRETIRASIYAKEHPEARRTRTRTTSRPAARPAGWRSVSSKIVSKGQGPELLKADVTGQPYLTLIGSETRDGNGNDHAVWANAKLTTAAGSEVWLDTLRPVGVKIGWGKFFAGRRNVSIGRSKFPRHIWAHAPSVVCYKLDPKRRFTKFEVYVGIDNRSGGGSVQFTIENKQVKGTPRGGRGGGQISMGALWQQLTSDFPRETNMIRVAYDWCRRDRLDVEGAASQFEPKAREVLAKAKKALEYVERDISRPDLTDELRRMEGKLARGGDWREHYLDVRALRRKIILSHPKLGFDRILINRTPPTKYSHNGDQHLGLHSRTGPGLTMLTNWKSGNPKVKAILEGKLPEGSVRNPDLHYDAGKVAFAFCDHTRDGKKRFFLYEAAVDGSWVRQLTGTKRDKFETWDDRATVIIEDNDPCYLPDEDIVFVSTRGQTFGRCHGGRYNPAWILYRCDPNGDNVKQLSFGNENEYEPSVLRDGRIVFTRWEYTNRHEMLFHMLWWCRQDGTAVSHFYGNDTLHPMMVVEARAIPGSDKVMATAMGHHSYNTGTTVVLDVNKGENGERPVTHLTPETPYSETRGWPEPHYSHPAAISEDLFLVSRANHKVHNQGKTPPPADRGIYLVDPAGGRELIYEDPDVASFSPLPILKRERPPVLSAVTPAKAPDYGTIFLQNAYLTRNDPEGKIKPGMIKAVRVNALGVQPRKNRTPCSKGCPNEIPKKVLGTVPVGEDGSAVIKVPARTSLQMQILDKNGMAILTELSLFYLQPGESRSCIGCHEPVGSTPNMAAMARSARQKPMDLTPAAGPQYPGGLSFMRTVQPVLDRYCIKCHGLDKTEKKVNLIHDGKMSYPRSYMELLKRGEHRLGLKGYMWDEKNISRPQRFFAYGNKVSHMLASGRMVKMDRDSYMRIIEFLDLNAQCYGDLFPNKLEERRFDNNALKELRAYVRELFGEKIASQPDRALVNVAQPDESRILMMPLAAGAGGWGQMRGFKSKSDPRFKKMQQLVDRCIVKKGNENRNGWQPTLEAGGGEKWVIDERRKYRSIAPSR